MSILKLNIIRFCVAFISLFAVSYSIYYSGFNIFEVFAQFTYISNLSVIVILFLISFNFISDKNILFVLPQITLTYIIFALLLSKGIVNETPYSLVEHYFLPIYLLCDYFLFVKERAKIYKVLTVLVTYTVIYMIYMYSYGYFSGYYPYFFIDLTINPLWKVVATSIAIIILVYVIFFVIVAAKQAQNKIYKRFSDKRNTI
ncbi:hypothetical protein ACFPDQ_06630 [Pseudofrancisella aestuarii]|uniref:Pr6Pr family membrane protein n=1 Tax=Pseudofrancisella aestuarii TaxID=2670347 RepID=A0ABV9TDN1_9GAMM|nr:hypothetical protein [Pseudofrancisella aestuarii]